MLASLIGTLYSCISSSRTAKLEREREREMERKETVCLSIVGFLGLLSAALSLAAEATRIKEPQVQITSSKCIYPTNNPASGLAFTAAFFLLVAQMIIIVLTGCSCCKRNPNRSIANCIFSMICLVCSWKCSKYSRSLGIILCTFGIAQVIFLVGALIDSQRGNESRMFGSYYSCTVVKRNQFAIAAACSLMSVIFGTTYADAFFSAKKNCDSSSVPAPSNQIGIAMGQPITPTRVQDPVFVHEDTYMRQQYP